MNITDDRQKSIVATTSLLVILTTLAVALRLMGRAIKGVRLGADDYMVLVALVNSARSNI